MGDAVPEIDGNPQSLVEVSKVVAKLIRGKEPGISNISVKLPKAEDEAMIRGFKAVLTAVCQSGTIPLNVKVGLVVSI